MWKFRLYFGFRQSSIKASSSLVNNHRYRHYFASRAREGFRSKQSYGPYDTIHTLRWAGRKAKNRKKCDEKWIVCALCVWMYVLQADTKNMKNTNKMDVANITDVHDFASQKLYTPTTRRRWKTCICIHKRITVHFVVAAAIIAQYTMLYMIPPRTRTST